MHWQKKVDRKLTAKKEQNFKEIKITNKLKVTKKKRSTSKVPAQYIRSVYKEKERVKLFAPKDFVSSVISALFGDADNN